MLHFFHFKDGVKQVKANGNYAMSYKLQHYDSKINLEICRQAFCNVYSIKLYTIKKLVNEIKIGTCNSDSTYRNDSKFFLTEYESVIKYFEKNERIKNNANLSIHYFLSQLERRIRHAGKLPSTIYYQMDGGSENANKYLLLFCELLIISGLTEHIYLTRLPVGHTHEDIDGKFAKIWKHARNRHIHTPMEYRELIITALTPSKLDDAKSIPVSVIDLFAIPDYKRYIADHIDKKFSGWTKEGNTQLQ